MVRVMLVVSNMLMLLDHEKTKIKRCKMGIGTQVQSDERHLMIILNAAHRTEPVKS